MKQFKVLLVLLFVGVLSSSFVTSTNSNVEFTESGSNEMIYFYVSNNTNKRVIVVIGSPGSNCNHHNGNYGVDAGKRKRIMAEKGSCIKIHHGDVLGTLDYKEKVFTVN